MFTSTACLLQHKTIVSNIICLCACLCVQDEVLSHRLGLIPLKVDPSLLDFKTAEEVRPIVENRRSAFYAASVMPICLLLLLQQSISVLHHCLQAPSEKNTLVFKLDVRCHRQGNTLVNERGEW